MKVEIEFDANRHTVDIARTERDLECAIDGETVDADAVQIAPGIYSILIGGQSFEVHVEPFGQGLRIAIGMRKYGARVHDPRKWERNRGSAASSDARQHVTAPMPGRVVRVLVKIGEALQAGQGIVVVEAMKMQNEVRSAKAGTVERLLVKEGQAVNAGDTIAAIT
jgi:biotin carboxyl carrier protein